MLREHVQAIRVAKLPELPPFVGGAVGYAGYDTVRYVENLPNAPKDDRKLPDLSFAFYDHMIVFDNVQKTVIVVVLAKVARARTSSEERCDGIRRCVSAGRSACREAFDADGYAAAGRYRYGGRRRARLSSRTSRSRSLKTRFASASSTFGPAISFRS